MTQTGRNFTIGDWCWLKRQASPCRVIERQDVWGEVAYRVWLPAKDAVAFLAHSWVARYWLDYERQNSDFHRPHSHYGVHGALASELAASGLRVQFFHSRGRTGRCGVPLF